MTVLISDTMTEKMTGLRKPVIAVFWLYLGKKLAFAKEMMTGF